MESVVIGVAGGSGSGKTTIAQSILDKINAQQVAYIVHDSYYRDRRDLPLEERMNLNFDHPEALETELLVKHLKKLKRGKSIEVPQYDFDTHTRSAYTSRIDPAPIIVVDGILVLENRELRDIMDMKIFVQTGSDLRFIRRLRRDIQDRGRDTNSVITQYIETVRPMHAQFVEPGKRYADIIIPSEGENSVAVEMVASHIKWLLRLHHLS